MRRLILKMSMTMDGFVGGPEGELHWLFPTLDVEAKRWIADTISDAGVHIMGSRTYADMAAYWPASKDVLAAPMNDIPKVVFSRSGRFATSQALDDAKRLEPIAGSGAAWGPPRVASGELADEIARLKAEPGKAIFAHGGGWEWCRADALEGERFGEIRKERLAATERNRVNQQLVLVDQA